MALVFLAHRTVALGIFLLKEQFFRTLVVLMVILYLEVIHLVDRCRPVDLCRLVDQCLLADHHLPVARDLLVLPDLRDPQDRLVLVAVAEAGQMEEGLVFYVRAQSSLMI